VLVFGFERPTLLCRVSIEIHALALEHKQPVWLRRSLARPRWNNGTRINHCEVESPAQGTCQKILCQKKVLHQATCQQWAWRQKMCGGRALLPALAASAHSATRIALTRLVRVVPFHIAGPIGVDSDDGAKASSTRV